jgi:hypothetical protein
MQFNISNNITINLPSFLRRVINAYALKIHIRSLGCELYRIGRSRNWQLKIELHTINELVNIIEQENEQSWLWVAKILRQQNNLLSHNELVNIAKRNANITLNELVNKTECTLAQARKVIDELEDLEE